MFSWLYNLLGTMLGWFSSIFGGSYALGLLLYALVFKIAFLPFTINQQKNQIAMAKLSPKISLIKAKYKGRTDTVTQQKMNQEIMELQQKEGYNPLSGCLPMLLQLPLILLLYKVIRSPISYIAKVSGEKLINVCNFIRGLAPGSEGYIEKAGQIDQIGFISEINNWLANNPGGEATLKELGLNVAKLPDFTLFGVNFAENPSFTKLSILIVIPVLAAVSQWFTVWITRKFNSNPASQPGAGDAQSQTSTKIMEFVMPLMTLAIAFRFSGMLGLYWVYQSIISIIQTLLLAKFMPIPKFTEEELKAMRKAEKEAEKASRAALKDAPKHRSLHYIDEDDYDELPAVKQEEPAKKLSGSDMPEIKD